jgi:NADH:ubiquinone oxidoreductase subunit C
MTSQEYLDKLSAQFGTRVQTSLSRERRLWVVVKPADLKPVLQWLKDNLGFYHVSTITGLDRGEQFEALYHLTDGVVELTVRTAVPRANPHLPTVTDILPGATLYERELHDMFGFVIDGHPDPRRYVLPEDWPDGVYPLRKDYKVNAGN